MEGLNDEEREIVRLVRRFVDRDVKPVVRELDHSSTDPAELIGTMRSSASSAWPSGRRGARPR